MGIKSAIVDKLFKKMMGNVNMGDIKKRVDGNEANFGKMLKIVESILGKESSDRLMAQIQQKVDNNEKVSLAMVADLVRKNLSIKDIEAKVKEGKVDLKQMQSTLNDLVGSDQTDKIFKDAQDIASEVSDSDSDDNAK